MNRDLSRKLFQKKLGAGIAVVAIAAVILTGVFSMKSGKLVALSSSKSSSLAMKGEAQLISVEPMASTDGEMCEWEPASASANMRFAFAQGQGSGTSARTGAMDPRALAAQRRPVRIIRDPYSAFSSVAIDHQNNEVIMTDENLFQVMVYDRGANTPPSAKMTEPKRVIAGHNTKIEFQCGLYIDPKTGDIYAVNNDTVDSLVIFSRQARGDVPPDRELHTPHGTFGIAVDEKSEEMYLSIQHDSAIVVFKKYATKEDAPLRLIQGDKTLLADPHGLALDTKNNLLFVTNFGSTHTVKSEGGRARRAPKPNWPLDFDYVVPGSGRSLPPSITVYQADSKGDVAPVRTITGAKTQLNWPTGIAIDAERGEIYVANDMRNEILVFDAAADGDVSPIRVLKGPKTNIKNPTGVYVDLPKDELWVTNFGNHTATVYKRNASGDTAPLRVIRSGPPDAPAPMMGNPHPITYDSKREEILVPN